MRRCIAALLGCSAVLSGCGQGGGGPGSILNSANSTMAVSCLRQIQSASSIYQVESEGRYATLKQILERGYIGREELIRALDFKEKPVPLSGYLFTDVTQEADGRPVDLRTKCGYVAYPASPGPAADKVFMLVADTTQMGAPANQDSFVSHGEEWTIYVAYSTNVAMPVKKMPAAGDIGRIWTPMKKRTPEEALQEAEALYRKAQEQKIAPAR
ncbi:MAG: hypothetical protein C0404_02985 [Verrucomicrobia bacterium]|nr:hypothetical protein [Verrucomicrobiota bacterium]